MKQVWRFPPTPHPSPPPPSPPPAPGDGRKEGRGQWIFPKILPCNPFPFFRRIALALPFCGTFRTAAAVSQCRFWSTGVSLGRSSRNRHHHEAPAPVGGCPVSVVSFFKKRNFFWDYKLLKKTDLGSCVRHASSVSLAAEAEAAGEWASARRPPGQARPWGPPSERWQGVQCNKGKKCFSKMTTQNFVGTRPPSPENERGNVRNT